MSGPHANRYVHPVEKKSSTGSGVSAIIKKIEVEAATQQRQARARYEEVMKEHRKLFDDAQKKAEAAHKEELTAIERWRIKAIAVIDPSQPVSLCEVRSVKRETTMHGAKVSVAKLSFLDDEKGGRSR